MTLSLEQKRDKVMAAIRAKFKSGLYETSCWPRATFDDAVIIEKGDELWRVPFTIDAAGVVTLGTETKVEITYTPIGEAFEGLIVGPSSVIEEGEADGSRWSVIVIESGVSQNRNHYKPQVLEAALPLYEGVSVFWDHATAGTPSAKDLVGFISGVSGALLEGRSGKRYSVTGTLNITDKVLRDRMLEAARLGRPDLYGLSHSVSAKGQIVSLPPHGAVKDVLAIEAVKTVDVVWKASAGGRALRIAEHVNESEGDLRMFEQLLEWLKTKRPDLYKKLSATPTEEQVRTLVQEALAATPAPSDATPPATPPAAPAAGAGATTTRVQESQPAADPNAALLRELLVDRAFTGRTVPDSMRTTLREDLDLAHRPTLTLQEAQQHIDRWVTAIAPMRDRVVGSGLGTVVETTLDEADKALKALQGFFLQKPVDSVPAFTSFKEGYITITGDKQITGELRYARNLRQFARLFESRTDLQEAMTTASWGEILGDSIRRAMLAMYRQPTIWDQWRAIASDITSPTDFRTNRRMRLAGYGDLPTVPQMSPYNALTSPTDEEATYTISKKGGTEKISIEMIANDDVGAIRRIPLNLSTAAKRTLAKSIFNLIRDNTVIYDGLALFHATHGNISANALSAAEITAARVAMAEQTPYGTADDVLDLYPKILMVPGELEELGWRLTTVPVHPNSNRDATEPNYIRQRIGLDTLIVVPYWTDPSDWTIVADPAQIPTIEVGFYQGRQEPDIYIADNPLVGSMFTHDAIDYKIRFIWGVLVQEYRGFFGGRVA